VTEYFILEVGRSSEWNEGRERVTETCQEKEKCIEVGLTQYLYSRKERGVSFREKNRQDERNNRDYMDQ
jgi:hypothetical protein